jgi:hypothetical protein
MHDCIVSWHSLPLPRLNVACTRHHKLLAGCYKWPVVQGYALLWVIMAATTSCAQVHVSVLCDDRSNGRVTPLNSVPVLVLHPTDAVTLP